VNHFRFTWANLLTSIRALVIAPTVYCIVEHYWFAAAALFSAAVVTDFLDGQLARRLHQTSAFGGLFDHATDALFVSLGCWAIAQLGMINTLLPWLIPVAFLQYVLDSKALAGVALRMSAIGKSNGVAYYAILGTAIGSELLPWHWPVEPIRWAAWALVDTTILSMLDRGLTLWRTITAKR